MKVLFLIDPLHELKIQTDTSLLFMEEACRRNYECYALTSENLFFSGNDLYGSVEKVKVDLSSQPVYEVISKIDIKISEFDVCFIRKDPPVDEHYIAMLQMLCIVEESGTTYFVNSPTRLLVANEKLYGLRHVESSPKTLITASSRKILDWVYEHGKPMVAKLTNEYGSRGIYILSPEDLNLKALVKMLTEEDRTYVIVQEFLQRVFEGDKRVFFLDGKVCGCISRVPQGGEYRCAVGLGADLVLPGLTDDEKSLCKELGELFCREGMFFVGIDLVDSRLLEINVTSPTLVRQYNELKGAHLERELYDRLEEKLKEVKAR